MTNRWTRLGLLGWMAVVGLVSAAAGCGGDKVVPPVGLMCIQNSECKNPLSCTFGLCHAACAEARDCPAGQTCVTGVDDQDQPVNVCLLPKERTCVVNSDCNDTLICGPDFQCRNMCAADKDCTTRTQRCIENVCAEPEDFTKDPVTGEYKLKPGTPPKDAGAKADAGAGMDAATSNKDAGMTKADSGATKVDAGPNTGPAPVDGVEVDRAIVRQGEINILITVRGKDLGNPTNLKLGDLKTVLKTGASDTVFEVTVSVPHGATLGTKDFSFQTDGGVGGKDKLITVSAITAAESGKDTNRGTSDHPFRTYKKSIAVADKGDSVQLGKGTYNVANGEDWALPLPEDITVSGEGIETKLVGPGSEGGSVSVDGFTFKGNGTIKNLSLGFFRYNAYLDKPNQKVSFEGVELTGSRTYAIYVTTAAKAAELKLKDTNVVACDGLCLSYYGEGAKLDISGGKIASLTSYALQISVKSVTVTIDGTEMVGGGTYDSIYTYQLGVTMTLKNAKIGSKIDFASSDEMMGALTIENTTVDVMAAAPNTQCLVFRASRLIVKNSKFLNCYYGIYQQSGEATIRTTQFTGYTYYGYYMTAGKLDLGTDTESGDNTFSSADGSGKYGLYDSRQLASTPITVSGTSFNDNVPAAKTETYVSGTYVDVPNRYRIGTVGNSIVFY
jgi:hypothetical protein